MATRATDRAMIELPHGFLSALFIALVVAAHLSQHDKPQK
jgi:hypothetical protein